MSAFIQPEINQTEEDKAYPKSKTGPVLRHETRPQWGAGSGTTEDQPITSLDSNKNET
jgi:hypothetical protein